MLHRALGCFALVMLAFAAGCAARTPTVERSDQPALPARFDDHHASFALSLHMGSVEHGVLVIDALAVRDGYSFVVIRDGFDHTPLLVLAPGFQMSYDALASEVTLHDHARFQFDISPDEAGNMTFAFGTNPDSREPFIAVDLPSGTEPKDVFESFVLDPTVDRNRRMPAAWLQHQSWVLILEYGGIPSLSTSEVETLLSLTVRLALRDAAHRASIQEMLGASRTIDWEELAERDREISEALRLLFPK